MLEREKREGEEREKKESETGQCEGIKSTFLAIKAVVHLILLAIIVLEINGID